MTLRSLADIPNKADYRLIGVTWRGDRISCVTVKNLDGSYSLRATETGLPIWSNLKGWEAVPGDKTQS